MMRAELFLRNKDQWHDSATHLEYISDEMLRSAKHAGGKGRNQQHRCWERNDHSPPSAPTISHITAFELLGSGNGHQLIKILEVYQGCLEVGQCWLMVGKLRSLLDELKDKPKACI